MVLGWRFIGAHITQTVQIYEININNNQVNIVKNNAITSEHCVLNGQPINCSVYYY